MALVTLANGKTIDVDIMWFLSLSDQEYQDLVASNSGFEIENPFHSSSLTFRGSESEEENEDWDVDDTPEDPDFLERDDI